MKDDLSDSEQSLSGDKKFPTIVKGLCNQGERMCQDLFVCVERSFILYWRVSVRTSMPAPSLFVFGHCHIFSFS